MARIDALSIKLENGSTADELAEVYGATFANVEKSAVSVFLKNPIYSGNPEAGTVEFRRFENAVSQAYGTARAAGAGQTINAKPIIISLDQDREIVEEITKKDIVAHPVKDIAAQRAINHPMTLKRELDTAFFTEAYVAGTEVSHTATTWDGKIEEMIVAVESVSNAFVDGVERTEVAVVVTPAVHSALRLLIDDMPATDNAYGKGAVGLYHGVPVYVSMHLPKASGQVVDAFAMRFGSIGQPVLFADAYSLEKIDLSNDFAMSLFYSYGTKALAEDLIFYSGDTYSAGS